jgi:hypothetical protein
MAVINNNNNNIIGIEALSEVPKVTTVSSDQKGISSAHGNNGNTNNILVKSNSNQGNSSKSNINELQCWWSFDI